MDARKETGADYTPHVHPRPIWCVRNRKNGLETTIIAAQGIHSRASMIASA